MAKATKKEPKTKTKQKKPRLAAVQLVQTALKFNADDQEAKALFLNTHLPTVRTLRAAVATATANLRNAYKSAKAHGFDKADFDTAEQLSTAEKEAKAKARIARQLVIARYMGSYLGAQLDFFLQPDRTPAVDRAYEEGQRASIENQPARPTYAPETEQYRRYMSGFHDHQEKIVSAKVTQLRPEEAKIKKQKVQLQKDEDAKSFDEPKPMSKAEFLARQQEAQSHFQKR